MNKEKHEDVRVSRCSVYESGMELPAFHPISNPINKLRVLCLLADNVENATRSTDF